jgi:hypothetical protein
VHSAPIQPTRPFPPSLSFAVAARPWLCAREPVVRRHGGSHRRRGEIRTRPIHLPWSPVHSPPLSLARCSPFLLLRSIVERRRRRASLLAAATGACSSLLGVQAVRRCPLRRSMHPARAGRPCSCRSTPSPFASAAVDLRRLRRAPTATKPNEGFS